MIRLSAMFLLCCPVVSVAAQSIPTKDPQVLQLLQSVLSQDAGYIGATDFIAAGSLVSTTTPSTTMTVAIKGRGIDQFKMLMQETSGSSSAVVSHGAGQYADASGALSAINYQAAETAGMVILPFRRIALLLADPTVGLSNAGTISLNGQTLSDLRFVLPANSALYGSTQSSSSPTSVDVYVDTGSGLITAILDWTYAPSNSATPLPHSYLFSNYQSVSGTQVPYSTVESIDNQPIWSVALTSIQFNVGLTDQDFQF